MTARRVPLKPSTTQSVDPELVRTALGAESDSPETGERCPDCGRRKCRAEDCPEATIARLRSENAALRERNEHLEEAARLLWDECSPYAPDWAYAPPADEAKHAAAIDTWLVAEQAHRAKET